MPFLLWLLIFAVVFVAGLLYAADWLTRHYTSLHDLNLINQPRPDGQKGNTAVVMGGGLAGILSARVLYDHFKHVIIVESDDYSDEDRVRPQVPQGAHAHLVLAIANLCLKTLFPSIETELIRRGAHVSDLGKAMKWFYWGSWRVRCDKDLPFWCCSRPFLDTLVRDMFLHFYGDKVIFLTKRQIQSPVLSTDLAALGINKHGLQKAIDGVVVTGDYTHIGTDIAQDEFRVVGIKIKKRGLKAPASNAAAPNASQDATTDNTADAQSQLDDVAKEKAAESALLTTTLKVQTNLTHSKGVKQIDPNPALNTAIKPRAIDHDEEYLLADLIVDATGGTSFLQNGVRDCGKSISPLQLSKPTPCTSPTSFTSPMILKNKWSRMVVKMASLFACQFIPAQVVPTTLGT
jgi:hypothetical protein